MEFYKIMTFNMRQGNGADGINIFENRKPRILDMIRSEAPDIIGFQEGINTARDWLRKELSPEYTVLGCGRNASYRGEGIPVAFRTDRFELYGFETFWLSDTPQIPGTLYAGSDQSPYPRMVHLLSLKPRACESPITFINTHLDHVGSGARTLAFRALQKRFAGITGCCVLTGDFNAEPDMEELKRFKAEMREKGWRDATEQIESTFHDYGRREPRLKIDYIFTNAPVKESYAVADDALNGIYYSDHQPVCALLELE